MNFRIKSTLRRDLWRARISFRLYLSTSISIFSAYVFYARWSLSRSLARSTKSRIFKLLAGFIRTRLCSFISIQLSNMIISVLVIGISIVSWTTKININYIRVLLLVMIMRIREQLLLILLKGIHLSRQCRFWSRSWIRLRLFLNKVFFFIMLLLVLLVSNTTIIFNLIH